MYFHGEHGTINWQYHRLKRYFPGLKTTAAGFGNEKYAVAVMGNYRFRQAALSVARKAILQEKGEIIMRRSSKVLAVTLALAMGLSAMPDSMRERFLLRL